MDLLSSGLMITDDVMICDNENRVDHVIDQINNFYKDDDKKILNFEPPITLENFKISFYKYDNTFYNFHNREHMLTFELDVADYDPKYRY